MGNGRHEPKTVRQLPEKGAFLASMPVAQLHGENMTTQNSGIGVVGALGVVFVALKLMGYIDWSWWWVTLPFWWGFGLMALTLVSASVLGLCVGIYRSIFK